MEQDIFHLRSRNHAYQQPRSGMNVTVFTSSPEVNSYLYGLVAVLHSANMAGSYYELKMKLLRYTTKGIIDMTIVKMPKINPGLSG